MLAAAVITVVSLVGVLRVWLAQGGGHPGPALLLAAPRLGGAWSHAAAQARLAWSNLTNAAAAWTWSAGSTWLTEASQWVSSSLYPRLQQLYLAGAWLHEALCFAAHIVHHWMGAVALPAAALLVLSASGGGGLTGGTTGAGSVSHTAEEGGEKGKWLERGLEM